MNSDPMGRVVENEMYYEMYKLYKLRFDLTKYLRWYIV